MERIFSVPLKGGNYTDVYFADDMKQVNALVEGNSFAVADENSASYLPECVPSIVLPSGEKEKNWNSVDKILSAALVRGLARDSLFIGVGGGVILDMTAFASSIYMRGARLMLLPTTLLAMVDATLGGKTGMDYGGGKNLVGTFYPAESVIIYPGTLRTLPDKEFRCGMGEVVKHSFLSSGIDLSDFLSDNLEKVQQKEEESLREMIKLSLAVKIEYITRDPEEKKGIRGALNLGHTFGHALEALRGFSLSHGEAVAWGTVQALRAGKAMGITSSDFADDGISLIKRMGFDCDYTIPEEEFTAYCNAIGKDKKKRDGVVKFVLMEGQGKPVLTPIPENIVKAVVCH